MPLSVLDLFKIGIGPSSSHTVGPMAAAWSFASGLRPAEIAGVEVDLYGSLALTGRGHATDLAVMVGLSGERPDSVDPDAVPRIVAEIRETGRLRLAGSGSIPFREADHLRFRMNEFLPRHPNAVRFVAKTAAGEIAADETYYSVGGGFVVRDGAADDASGDAGPEYAFGSADELLRVGAETDRSFAEILRSHEDRLRPRAETDRELDRIRDAMDCCIERGCRTDGILPGGLGVRRRAAGLFRTLTERPNAADPMAALDWVSLFALAVNEENAAGGRVVTAPTNGAAGVVPAVLTYARRFMACDDEGVRTFLLTAGAIGMLFKRNASLSAAEMGCQGEVGVACSMAAGGLAAIMGGTNAQIENAAEIGMEHNLGLTCDPIAGLVQIPCIERNTMGALKAVNAARLAVLHGDGRHRVSLDRVIETMRQTGHDMQSKYKETSLGGLAVNVPNC